MQLQNFFQCPYDFIDEISDLPQIAQYLNFLLLSSGHKSMSKLHIFFYTDIANLSSPEY